jgi:hypothetical protein
MVAAAGERAGPGAGISITITAKALGEIDLVIATCPEIALADIAESGLQSYEMATNLVRLDALTGDPTVVVRAREIEEPTGVTLQIRVEASGPNAETNVSLPHDFGDVTLTAETPMASLPLPLSSFRSCP